VDNEEQPILRIPHVLRPGTVAPQPQDAIDPAHIEAFGDRVIGMDGARYDGQGARWGPMLCGWVPLVTFRLVKI
jgi:hypothetical protein